MLTTLRLWLSACALSLATQPSWALDNPSFEYPGGGVAEDVRHTMLKIEGVPGGWVADQWREPFAPFECAVDESAARSGRASVRLSSDDLWAKMGMSTEAQLPVGRYRVRLWARCQPGGKALLCMRGGDDWLAMREVGEEWTECECTAVVSEPQVLEVRTEYRSCRSVWIDDASVEAVEAPVFRYVRDRRPHPPRTLLFSPLAIEDLRRDAAVWAQRGFGGFLLDRIMSDWSSNVWEADGEAATVGEADATFRALEACNEACAPYGIRNFIKVAFYSELPLWTDDEGWARAAENFRQCAIMARDTGCAGIALDTEYVSKQYNPRWEGYTYQGYTEEELRRAAGQRGRQIVEVMLSEYSEFEFLLLPEGPFWYGPLHDDLFRGLLGAMVEADAPGGLHLLAENSYSMRDYEALVELGDSLGRMVKWGQPEAVLRYWERRCSVALEGYPLGYYRKIVDAEGKMVGYGGRKEIFDDEVVGSTADRGPRFPLEDFRQMMAGLSAGSGRYNWIYAHGATWWPTEGELEVEGKTPREVEQARARRAVANLEEYYAIVRDHYLMAADEG